MDKKVVAALAVVVVAILVAGGILVSMSKSPEKEIEPAAIEVESGAVISADMITAGIKDATGDNLIVSVTGAGNDTNLKFTASDLKQVVDAKKNLVIRHGSIETAVSSKEVKEIAALDGNVTVKVSVVTDSKEITKVLGEKYTEARVLAKFTVVDSYGDEVKTSGTVSITVPYKLDSTMDETAETAVQWDKDLKTTSATYKNGAATISATAGDNVVLAFMTAEDSAYYPITYTTKANGLSEPFQQTVTHKPTRIVTLYESTTELALLFGLKDYIVMACANSTYSCVNSELQDAYNSLPGRSEYDNVINSKEIIVGVEPDLILGWSSSFEADGKWSVGTYSDWNGRGCTVFACNVYNKTLEMYYELVETIGKIMNMEDRAAEIVNEFKKTIADSANKLAVNNVTEKKNVIVIEQGGSTSSNFLYGAQYFTGDLISKCGGVDVVDAGMIRVQSAEEVLAYCFDEDGNCIVDAVFLFNRAGKTTEEAVQEFRDNVAYTSLSTAVGDDIYVFGFYELYMGGVVETTILEKIFACLYPDLA